MKRAPIRVETEQSLRVREAVVEVADGIVMAKYVPILQSLDEGITEVTADELAEYVRDIVERRLGPRML